MTEHVTCNCYMTEMLNMYQLQWHQFLICIMCLQRGKRSEYQSSENQETVFNPCPQLWPPLSDKVLLLLIQSLTVLRNLERPQNNSMWAVWVKICLCDYCMLFLLKQETFCMCWQRVQTGLSVDKEAVVKWPNRNRNFPVTSSFMYSVLFW